MKGINYLLLIILSFPSIFCIDTETNERKLDLVPQGGYPEEVEQLFKNIPEFEYYEPEKGEKWGFVTPTGIFPFETSSNPEAFYRDTPEPATSYKGMKYIIFFYDYSRIELTRTKNEHLIFIPYMLLVEDTFN